jgi:peptidoglycan/LPS O-acetylase OafA/YrhL
MKRIPELDGLRGVWAVLILLSHATSSAVYRGWSRVDLFFVLSGFLATSRLLGREIRWSDLPELYARRAFRLLPAYYVLLMAVTFMVFPVEDTGRHRGLLHYLTLTQNVSPYWGSDLPAYLPQYLQHTWAIALEAQFSLAWPVVVLLVGRGALVPLLLWLTFGSVLLRAWGLHPWTLLARGDGLTLGGLLAVLLVSPQKRNTRKMSASLIVVGVFAFAYNAWSYVDRDGMPWAFDRPLDGRESLAVLATNVIYVCLVGFIVCHSGHPALAVLRAKSMEYLGALGFGIYLFSFPAIRAAEAAIGRSAKGGIDGMSALAVALALGAAILSLMVVERPLRRLGRHLGSIRTARQLASSCADVRPAG